MPKATLVDCSTWHNSCLQCFYLLQYTRNNQNVKNDKPSTRQWHNCRM